MAKHNDNMFRKVVTEGLRKQHTIGLSQGSYAMCKVILDMANQEDKTDTEKIEAIRTFCGKCVDPKTLMLDQNPEK